jgi:hypothetical protein
MQQFRKLKITITHIENSNGEVLTEFRAKGTANFTLEEIDKTINSAKRDWYKTLTDEQKKAGNVFSSTPVIPIIKRTDIN